MIFNTLNEFLKGNSAIEQTIALIQRESLDLAEMPVNKIDAVAASLLQEAQTNLAARCSFAAAFSACSVNPPLRSQLVNQVLNYLGLLNKSVDLKPLVILIEQPDYLTTLPEPLLLQIVEQMDLRELARLQQTSGRLKAVAAAVLKTIASQLGLCSSDCQSFKSIWDALSAHIGELEDVPPDVATMIKAPPAPHSLPFLLRWLKARDCLTVWKILANLSGDFTRLNVSSGPCMIEQAACFGSWLTLFRPRLPKELYLSNLKLTFLPKELGKLQHLVSLCLDRNKLKELPPELSQLENLERLTIEQNRLDTLPPWIGNLSRLKSLDVSKNCLSLLPVSMGRLAPLKRLNVNYNSLQGLPASIGHLRALEFLELAHNQLNSLPEGMGQLTALLNLNLNGNSLSSLPAGMERLTSLSILSLESNRIDKIPSFVWRLHSLRELNLSGNAISSLDPCTEPALSLQTLNLSNNWLASLPSFLIQLTALHTLFLDHNHLTELPPEIEKLTELSRLDLQENPLAFLPPSIYRLSSLRYLYLPEMPEDAVSPFLTRRSLYILKVGDRWLIAPPPSPYDDSDCRIA